MSWELEIAINKIKIPIDTKTKIKYKIKIFKIWLIASKILNNFFETDNNFTKIDYLKKFFLL